MRTAFAVLLCMLCSGLIYAQEYPRAEVFGGYSYLHIDTQGITGPKLDAICNEIDPGFCPAGTFGVHPGFNGWNASAQVNVDRWFGVKADFSGYYGTPLTAGPSIEALLKDLGVTSGFPPKVNAYNFLFGPVFSDRAERFTVFGHALFGTDRVGTNSLASILQIPGLTVSDNAFAMAFGGGVDLKVSNHVAVRLGQADYLYTKHDFSFGVPGVSDHQNNLRFSAGVVFQFGGTAAAPVPAKTTTTARPAVAIAALGILATDWKGGGVEIVEVEQTGAAGTSGLHVGDVINSIDGKLVNTPGDLMADLSAKEPGASVRLGVMIRGQWQSEKTVTPRGK